MLHDYHRHLDESGTLLEQPIETRSKDIFVSSSLGMAIANAAGQFIEVNASCCEITGYTQAELLSTDLFAILFPDDRERSLKSSRIEARLIKKGGEKVWVQLDLSLMQSSGQQLVIFVIHDITIRKDREALTIKDLENFKLERQLREQFIQTLTHDLRNPLTAARISAQLIHRQPNRPEICEKLSKKIIEDIDRTDSMVINLLDSDRIRGGKKLGLSLSKWNLECLLSAILDDLMTVHGERFILVNHERIEGYWDEKGLRRAIENLCNNAIKYGDLQSSITLSYREVGEEVWIAVHNEGNPISEEEQENLFQHFHRSQKAQAGPHQGWGIGLTLVRGVAESHGGRLKLESNSELGTVFTLILPKDARPYQVE